MARLSRLYAPDTPQLVQVRFTHPLAPLHEPAPADKLNLLADWLRSAAHDSRVRVHGWALLNDRLALLATPSDKAGVAGLIQAVGRRFATRLEKGRVFAERYRSALLQPNAWVLPALIWLDRLPVQHHHVDDPTRWPWSSATQHTGIGPTAAHWAHEHVDYWKLGNTPFERQAHYRRLLEEGLDARPLQQLEDALFGQWALGDEDFLARLKRTSSRRLSPAKRGRPRSTRLPGPQQPMSPTAQTCPTRTCQSKQHTPVLPTHIEDNLCPVFCGNATNLAALRCSEKIIFGAHQGQAPTLHPLCVRKNTIIFSNLSASPFNGRPKNRCIY